MFSNYNDDAQIVQLNLLMRLLILFLWFSVGLTINAHATNKPSGHATNPTIICPKDTVLITDPFNCAAIYTYAVEVYDDQPGWNLVQTGGLPSGSPFPKGTTVNQFVVTDSDGNTAACTSVVTVVDEVPPNAVCDPFVWVNIGPVDDSLDCYGGYVTTVYAITFEDGSYDNCGGELKFTIQRQAPYSDFINSLNPLNGHPDCSDSTPDSLSEFERATGEFDNIKFYCGEAGIEQSYILRVYQLDDNGEVALGANGLPLVTECLGTVVVKPSVFCEVQDSSAVLEGLVMIDNNNDCLPDPGAEVLSNMTVKVETATGTTLYTVTGDDGSYRIGNLPAGTTQVTVSTVLPIWDFCSNSVEVNLPSAPSATGLDFRAASSVECPVLTVDLAAPSITNCATHTWPVSYYNRGNAVATNATIQVRVPAPYNLVDADLPFTIQGEVLTISLGDVAAGASGKTNVRINVPCDPALDGQSICVEAAIAPIATCLPPTSQWPGAQIEASAVCQGDSTVFTLTNKGTAPTATELDYLVIDDMVVMRTGQIPAGFLPDAIITETVYSVGKSLRLQAEQESGHPLAVAPSIGIENCNGNSGTSNIVKFSNEDGNPFTSLECRQIAASGNANRLSAYPEGIGSGHVIRQDDRITYQVDFQNTSFSTVNAAVVRCTIPAQLDLTTLQLGASSHPYTWSLRSGGVIDIRFEPINLSAASTNEANSRGFVQFDLAVQPNTLAGTVVVNTAEVYFDLLPTITTNGTFHTIGENVLPVRVNIPGITLANARIFPNPANDHTFLSLEQVAYSQVRVTNMLGQTVAVYNKGQAAGVNLVRGAAPSGVYLVEVLTEGVWQKAGTLVWE
jgi:hypothetical protein